MAYSGDDEEGALRSYVKLWLRIWAIKWELHKLHKKIKEAKRL